ncbi:Cysteine-rich receptor-like protein kinase 10 [Hordeum vulgare]|nr:Cysteine-rich receptor-like protein kinase 10 [Hordeum vulgare]
MPPAWPARGYISGGIVINEGGSSSHPVKPKTEPTLFPVKQEHLDMAAADKTALKWALDDYVREEMERQCHALEMIAARHRDREEGSIVILDDNGEEALVPSNLIRHGDPGRGCNKDDGEVQDIDDDDGNDDGGDYTNF